MQPIIERTWASFPDQRLRVLSPDEVRTRIRQDDIARLTASLRQRGYYPDPFDMKNRRAWKILPDHSQQEVEVVMAADLPPEEDPFAVSELVVRQVVVEPFTDDETIPWAEADRALHEAQVEAAERAERRERLTAGLSPGGRLLAHADPFRVTPRVSMRTNRGRRQ